MKYIRKIIINNKILLSFIISIFLSSCGKPKIYFNVSKQEIIECGNFELNNIYIVNDSIDEKGFFIEPQIYLKWNDSKKAPFSVSLNNISSSYQIYRDNKVIKNFKLMNDTSYTISQGVSGKSAFSIRVWTNNQGKIYKTTHNECNNVSLDMK